MARDTLADTKAELVGLVRSGQAPTVSGVAVVYDYLPPVDLLSGPVALAVYTDHIDPMYWYLGVRVFSVTGDMKQAQDDLDTLLPAVDNVLTDGFGPSNWVIASPTDLAPYWTATSILEVPRGDLL